MNNKTIEVTLDLRVRRTNKLLIDALTSLLKEKAFDDIRVSDICNKAMVHRTTFYKHFEDKYQLLDCLLEQIIIKFKEKNTSYISNINSREYYINLIKVLFEHMHENKKLYSIGLLNNDSAGKILKRTILECLIASLESNVESGINFTIPIHIIAEFYSAAIVNLASWWLKNNMTTSIDEMVEYSDLLINRLDDNC